MSFLVFNVTLSEEIHMSDNSKMCATIEIINYKPGKLEVAAELTDELESEYRAVAGMKHMICLWNDGDKEYLVNIWESPEAKEAAASEVSAIGAKYGDIFEDVEYLDFKNVSYVVE